MEHLAALAVVLVLVILAQQWSHVVPSTTDSSCPVAVSQVSYGVNQRLLAINKQLHEINNRLKRLENRLEKPAEQQERPCARATVAEGLPFSLTQD